MYPLTDLRAIRLMREELEWDCCTVKGQDMMVCFPLRQGRLLPVPVTEDPLSSPPVPSPYRSPLAIPEALLEEISSTSGWKVDAHGMEQRRSRERRNSTPW